MTSDTEKNSSNVPGTPIPGGDTTAGEEDASLKEILYYAFGNVEAGLANQFYYLLNTLMIVALGMSPVLLGLILSIKTIWDGIADPVMAQISDNARTRWGRRRPFILVGGVSRSLLLVGIFAFFPQDPSIKSNSRFAAEQNATTESVPTAVPAKTSDSSIEKPAIPAPRESKAVKPGVFESIKQGYSEFISADNAYHKKVTLYILISCLLFTTFGTVANVPYYALGIELCPSYDGRTRVVTYRSIVDKATNLVGPWILPFCFLPIFLNVIDGLFWYSVSAMAAGIPTTVLMVMKTRERFASNARQVKGPGLLLSIWLTAKNIHFLKILFLYQFIGYTNGIFAQIMLFLTIYWVFAGDALAGTTLVGYTSTVGTLLAFLALPLVNIACRRFQKHRALRYGIIWMSIGTALNWFLVDPAHPYWQLALPFFFAIGISSVYTILPTMMADVTDIDELRNGTRREGMFGAVMGFLMKLTGSFQPVIAGAMLVFSGFDVTLGANQTPEAILRMRVMFSVVPAGLLLLALVALWRYPLTREYMEEVKGKLRIDRATRDAESVMNG